MLRNLPHEHDLDTAEKVANFLNEQHAQSGADIQTHLAAPGIKVEFGQLKETVINRSSELKQLDQQMNDFFSKS